METLWQDIRYGIRMLLKSPGFTAVAVLTLALGIGANTTIFSVVNAFLLRPLPVKDPSHLVFIFDHFPDLDKGPASYPDFVEWRQQSRVFEDMVASFPTNYNFVGQREPERIRGRLVSENYFSLLGVQPLQGRNFVQADHKPDAGKVAIVSYEFWQREYGGDPALIGKAVALNGISYTVVGILPPESAQLSWRTRSEIWVPLEPNAPWKQRGTNYLNVIARLAPGVPLARARSEVTVIQDRINQQFPGNKHDVVVVTVSEQLSGDARPSLLLLLGAEIGRAHV
jgi:hypothetical protein